MRIVLMSSLYSVLLFGFLGCGGSSETIAPTTSELQKYADENADALAKQAAVEAARAAQEADEDADE